MLTDAFGLCLRFQEWHLCRRWWVFLSADSNPKTYLTCAISCYDPCRLDLLDLGGVGDDSPGTRNANVPAGRRTRRAGSWKQCQLTSQAPAQAVQKVAVLPPTQPGLPAYLFSLIVALQFMSYAPQGNMATRASLSLQLSSDKGSRQQASR